MLFPLNTSVLTLIIVFILVAFRQIGGLKLHIWQIMLLGALTVLLTGQISPYNGLRSINLDVMIFLLGMFITGEAMHPERLSSSSLVSVLRESQEPGPSGAAYPVRHRHAISFSDE
jgi:Na+/H+ antiporter NhaD/arsenite permease-like protein